MFVLDSLGMLSTEKEITDVLNDKQVRDMTKSQLVKGAFRMLTLKLGQANIPMIVTNHTYDVIGAYVPTKEMGGGSGLKYAASTIIYLSKKKEKDGTEIVGNLIKAKTAKSRLSKENKDVTVRLYYDNRGLDRYYGLLELGELGGLWKNVAGRYEIDGKKVYAKANLQRSRTILHPRGDGKIRRDCKNRSLVMDNVEFLILRNLLHNEEYVRKVIPFIKADYFENRSQKIVYEEILKFVEQYNKPVTKEILCIETEKRQDITDGDYKEITQLISSLEEAPTEFDWLVSTTEKWCRDRAIYLALMESHSDC